MSRLFHAIAQPRATSQTLGAFLGGLRVMAVDGTTLDVPDSEANARVWGYPGSRKGTRAARSNGFCGLRNLAAIAIIKTKPLRLIKV